MSSTGEPDAGALGERFAAELETRPVWLREHCERVAAVATQLARRHGLDAERCATAALGHDLFRHVEPARLLSQATELGIAVNDVERAVPLLLHGPVAACVAEREWGAGDAERLEAIRWHTTAHPALSSLGRIVFLADKIEPAKLAAKPALGEIETLAQDAPDAALLAFLNLRLGEQLARGQFVHPTSVETRNVLLAAGSSDGGG